MVSRLIPRRRSSFFRQYDPINSVFAYPHRDLGDLPDTVELLARKSPPQSVWIFEGSSVHARVCGRGSSHNHTCPPPGTLPSSIFWTGNRCYFPQQALISLCTKRKSSRLLCIPSNRRPGVTVMDIQFRDQIVRMFSLL